MITDIFLMGLSEEQKRAIAEYGELKYEQGYKDGYTSGFLSMAFFAAAIITLIHKLA